MNIAQKLFRRFNLITEKPIYNIVEIDFSDEEKLAQVIPSLQRNNVDAYIIRNVYSSEMIDKLLGYFNQISENKKSLDISIDAHPYSFIQYMYTGKMEEVVGQDLSRFNDEVEKNIGINLQHEFTDLVEKLNGGIKTRVKEIQKNKFFTSFQVRWISNKQSGISPHCEDLILSHYQEANKMLGDYKLENNSIPFFITLQKAQGGNLTLLDYKWNGNQMFQPTEDGYLLHDLNAHKSVNVADLRKIEIETNPGDMTIFNGSKIWHYVTPTEGEESRITIGAFVNERKDKEFEIWS